MKRDMVVISDEMHARSAYDDYSHVWLAGMGIMLTEVRERVERALRRMFVRDVTGPLLISSTCQTTRGAGL